MIRFAAITALGLATGPALAQNAGALTPDEAMAFRDRVMSYWNVQPESPASRIAVTLAFSMTPDGRPRAETVRLTGQRGGGASTGIRQAFDTAKRAVMRCAGESGYDLPAEKYGSWQSVVIHFQPEETAVK